MKNNQVYLDPKNIAHSMKQLMRFYRLDYKTMDMLRRIVEKYPKPVILYVDEANAPLMAHSPLDDPFTFNTETGELVLFSAKPEVFVDALIEMWMYISGFETLLGDDDHWKIEFAIGAWKPVKNTIKRRLGIPVMEDISLVVGLPPDPDEAPPEDPYPFRSLTATFNRVAFEQMIRLAGRAEVQVHFPPGTHPQVIEVYQVMRKAMYHVAANLGIDDAQTFNQRLHVALTELEKRYHPKDLPEPPISWLSQTSRDAASGEENPSRSEDNEASTAILLGPPEDDEESPFGRLPTKGSDPDDMTAVDLRLRNGPFARFIDTLFED